MLLWPAQVGRDDMSCLSFTASTHVMQHARASEKNLYPLLSGVGKVIDPTWRDAACKCRESAIMLTMRQCRFGQM